MTGDDLDALALAVRAARKRRRWGQQELAREAGVSLGVISNLERGKTRPQPANERAILAALGLEPEQRLNATPDEPRYTLAEARELLGDCYGHRWEVVLDEETREPTGVRCENCGERRPLRR